MNFQPVTTIARKRDGHPLCDEELAAFLQGYTRGEIPDYQMAALAMAIYLRGMLPSEVAVLTKEMLKSGATLQWPDDAPPIADKHSTGGVGDKVSLVLAPLLACCGVWVPMISGRGLGPTGGTLDKLESIPGFRTSLSLAEIRQLTKQVGCVITGASAEIAPADKKLYALRDVTGTVPSIPLITASIMSKKLAEGLDALVLDVKWGSGAFMKSLTAARELANSLVSTGQRMSVTTTALLTDMNQPLGKTAGNALEINEAVQALAGDGARDLVEVTFALGAELLVSSGIVEDVESGRALLQQHIASGAGLEKFRQMVSAQGGSLDAARPIAPAHDLCANRSGTVVSMDAEKLGLAVIEMGGGRRIMTDRIDHSVGLEFLVRIGDRVESNQPLARVFASRDATDRARQLLSAAFRIGDEPVRVPDLIVERIAS